MDIAESYGATAPLAWEGRQYFAVLIDYTSRLEAAGLSVLVVIFDTLQFVRNLEARFQGLVAADRHPQESVGGV